MAALKGEEIQGQGRTERDWSTSAQLAALPTSQAMWLIGASRRIVVVAPHPDDEVLGCGGLLAMLAASGHRNVLIVSATDGEAAYPNDEAWPSDQLALARQRELIAAMEALGINAPEILRLNLGDGRLNQNQALLEARLDEVIRMSDTVLVTYAADGHPDHEACAQAVQTVASKRKARLVQFPVWAWHWGDVGHAQFLENAVRITLSPQAHAAKLGAIKAFATQIGSSQPPPREPILPPWALARFERDFEVFIL